MNLTLTPYQEKILRRADEASTDETSTLAVLLDAIEERDKLLQEFYHFFGPAQRTAEKIAKVLEIP